MRADPLLCFVAHPGASSGNNVCPHTYTAHPSNNVTSCALLCLADAECDAFAMGDAGDPASTDCRTSHSCARAISHLDAYDGYQRKPGGDCGGWPKGIIFHSSSGLFADGMILQRGSNTAVWGEGAKPRSTVTVSVGTTTADVVGAIATTTADVVGGWRVVLPTVEAAESTTLSVTDGESNATLRDVAFGDVLLCGGQSNMGFGMCGAQSANQTPAQALQSLAPLRMFFQAGSGPYGGAGTRGCPVSVRGQVKRSMTEAQHWFKANATNSGGFSAVCMLTAQRLYDSLRSQGVPAVPVGAVESCISGTPVGAWTPSNRSATSGGGVLWEQHMVGLLPMTFKAAIWDQGEADAKRTSSSYYASEFPLMISLWRRYFTAASPSTSFPFVYVELCVEYGAEPPKEADFWLAQRAAVADDPLVGFAVTTDIQRALHPPDKQDVSERLTLELRRLAYGHAVVSRGPELRSQVVLADGKLALRFSNSSLTVHAGILVGNPSFCAANAGNNSMAVARGPMRSLHYWIHNDTVLVECPPGVAAIHINADSATCFLYGPHGLPAPPIIANCTGNLITPPKRNVSPFRSSKTWR